MTFWVGFDVGKTFHWVSLLDDAGEVVLSRRVEATEQGLEAACSQIAGLSEERKVALDVLGGPTLGSCWRSSPSVASRSFTCRG